MRLATFVLAGAAVLAVPALALANGRPPATNGIHFKPGDAHSLYLATTFGLMISHDDGCTFDFVCEENIGYGGTFDPIYTIAADGTIYAATLTGLRISHDNGCSFSTATESLPSGSPNRLVTWVNGLDLGSDNKVWVATADTATTTGIYSSSDGGATFTASFTGAPSMLWQTLKVAPTDATRVYVGGYSFVSSGGADAGSGVETPALYLTSNGGTAWAPSPLTGIATNAPATLRVLAVDPRNALTVYVSLEQAVSPVHDLLYRSTDGGMTFQNVLTTDDLVRDLAFVDDHTVLVAAVSQSFTSTDNGITFSAMNAPPQLQCLGVAPDGSVIGCGANWDPDFMAVTKSMDHAATWAKVWRFANLHGPLNCPAGTAEQDTCAANDWPPLRDQFGATGPTCGDNIWPGEVPKPPAGGGGCCDTGGSPVSLVWALGVAFWVGRRRRAGATTGST